jgi:general secretion pathway protein G
VYINDYTVPPDSLADVGYDNLRDPWGNPYKYLKIIDNADPGVNGKRRKDHSLVPVNSDYDLYSMGPDGDSKAPFTARASRDDIVRASNGAFIGPVSEF